MLVQEAPKVCLLMAHGVSRLFFSNFIFANMAAEGSLCYDCIMESAGPMNAKLRYIRDRFFVCQISSLVPMNSTQNNVIENNAKYQKPISVHPRHLWDQTFAITVPVGVQFRNNKLHQATDRNCLAKFLWLWVTLIKGLVTPYVIYPSILPLRGLITFAYGIIDDQPNESVRIIISKTCPIT